MIHNSVDYLKTSTPKNQNDFDETGDNTFLNYGNYMMFFKYRSNDYICAIGPHWYVSVIGFGIIAAVGGLILVPLFNQINIFIKVGYLFFYLFALLNYLIMFFKSPGIIPQKRNFELSKDIENKKQYECLTCLSLKTQKAYHCEECDVCIEEFDHHCIWVGKCVGKRNLVNFYIFVVSIPVFFIYVMFMSCFISLNLPNGH